VRNYGVSRGSLTPHSDPMPTTGSREDRKALNGIAIPRATANKTPDSEDQQRYLAGCVDDMRGVMDGGLLLGEGHPPEWKHGQAPANEVDCRISTQRRRTG
jgi:hypothetical protein